MIYLLKNFDIHEVENIKAQLLADFKGLGINKLRKQKKKIEVLIETYF